MNFTNLCTQAINNPDMTKRKQYITSKTGAVKEVAVQKIPMAQVQGSFYQESYLKKYWIATLIFIGLSFGLYFACLPFNYVLDDQMVITGNSFTKKGFSGIWDILTTESFEGYFGEKKELVQGNRYRPLSIITFAVEYGLVGDMNPWLSHFINVLLYALTGVLLMMVLVNVVYSTSYSYRSGSQYKRKRRNHVYAFFISCVVWGIKVYGFWSKKVVNTQRIGLFFRVIIQRKCHYFSGRDPIDHLFF